MRSSFKPATGRFFSLKRWISIDETDVSWFHEGELQFGSYATFGQIFRYFPLFHTTSMCFAPQSTTTTLQIAFAASCRTFLHVSLMLGLTVQEELHSTFIGFQFHKYIITPDIEKMCRQPCLVTRKVIFKSSFGKRW